MVIALLMTFGVAPLLAWGAYHAMQSRSMAQALALERAGAAPTEVVTLVRVSIAFDAGARASLSGALDRGGARAGARPSQLVGALAERLVSEIEHAKLFAVGVSRQSDRETAMDLFGAELERQRARYRPESARAQSGTRSAFRDGGGYVLVTLFVARTVDVLVRSGRGATIGDLCVVLKVLCSAKPEHTLAAECVWVPGDAADVLTMSDLAENFGELVHVAEGVSGGDFCATLCPFCTRAYPAEAAVCPNCRRHSAA